MQFKWLTVPWSNKTKQVQAVQMWEVRWKSRHGEYSGDVQPELECFPSKEEADGFAKSLNNAFTLIRTTSGHCVNVRKSKDS